MTFWKDHYRRDRILPWQDRTNPEFDSFLRRHTRLIRMLRGPARAAGFGRLQGFLEEGLQAFREMGDGTDFILTIWQRESAIRDRLLAGDGAPFRAVAA